MSARKGARNGPDYGTIVTSPPGCGAAPLAKPGGGVFNSAMGFDDVTAIAAPVRSPRVAFDRRELSLILAVYGRMVAAGLWRDYAIDTLSEASVFSIFRRSAEHPIYRVQKRPRDAARQGAYSVVGMDGRILKRGRDLAQVLRIFDAKLIRAVE